MVRRHITALRLGLMAADGLSAIALFGVVSIFRFGSTWFDTWLGVGVDARILAVLYAVGWTTILWLFGLYRLRVRWSVRTELIDIGRSVLVLAVATFVVLFWLKLPNVSRQFLLLLFPAQLVMTVASRFTLRRAFSIARARGMNSRFVLIVGAGPTAVAFADRLERHREMGLHVIGHLDVAGAAGSIAVPTGGSAGSAGPATTATDAAETDRPQLSLARPILGSVDEIEHVLHSMVVDEVAICLPSWQIGLIEPITRLCEDEGRIVRIPTDQMGFTLPGARIEDFDGIRILSVPQAGARPRGVSHGPDPAQSAVRPRRALDPDPGRRPDPLPPDPNRRAGAAIRRRQVSDHGRRCRGSSGRPSRPERDPWPRVQGDR